jgi:hypothetical protein
MSAFLRWLLRLSLAVTFLPGQAHSASRTDLSFDELPDSPFIDFSL